MSLEKKEGFPDSLVEFKQKIRDFSDRNDSDEKMSETKRNLELLLSSLEILISEAASKDDKAWRYDDLKKQLEGCNEVLRDMGLKIEFLN
ncbi:hypothetical protein HYV70_02620 [Candidatus Uhrbacteria bacterium]|nr:hypothetical protein [Candidatus Uhrbacteria bacterium]